MARPKQTPMMRQYHNLKQQYKDKILLFRMGDFYETFGEDAETTARVLNIALTTRDKKEDPTPLAGFPHHALKQYLPKLVSAGYNVAIADQVEDPKFAKGIVRREITRIVTPGTLTDETDGQQTKNLFIVSLFETKGVYGIAVGDLSTGSLQITQTSSSRELLDEIGRIAPVEILIPPKQDFSILSHMPMQVLEEHDYSYENSKSILTNHFNVKTLSSFGITPYKAAIISAGAFISYLSETQQSGISHISTLSYYDLKGNMVLDYATIRNLDLVESSGESSAKNSLFAILNSCVTGMGARKLRSWILHPLLDKKNIEKRNTCVEHLYANPDDLSHTLDLLKQVSDLERISGRLGLNRANARDLLHLRDSLQSALVIKESLENETPFTHLVKKITANTPGAKSVLSTITKSIQENPPLAITEGHMIKDGYSKEIDAIRSQTSDSKEWIESLEEHERERTKISSLKVRMNKVFGYYIEVTNTHKDKVPDDYIRKQTLVNSERYVTPELKEKEQIVFSAEEKLASLEYESFQEIREKILAFVQQIQEIADVIATIDVLSSFAHVARMNDYSKPALHDMGEKKGILKIKNGRHPIVELTTADDFINNDLNMDREENRLIILTGPNMSGKSTFIRQMALIILMAQIGSFVPASSAEISIVDRIFTRVGASDDLTAGRSTFMVEMDEAANIVNNATQHSFIVLDEVGRGTSTYDGVSIAWAIAEYIHDSIGARCLFATHYHELLKLEGELDGVQNYNVAVLEEKDSIIFLRKIEPGGTDRSYGIYVAQMAGLPDNVIERASSILEGFEQENMFGVRNEPKKEGSKRKAVQPEIIEETDPASQLSFIDSSRNGDIPNMFEELKELDINNLTPIQALQLLEKWKKRVGK